MAKPSKEEYYSIAKEVYDFFLSVRFSPAQAAGMVALVDSASSMDSSKGLFGISQERADVLCNGNKQYFGCGIKLDKDTSVSAALEMVWFALRTIEKDALVEILDTETAYDAGYAASTFFGLGTDSVAGKIGNGAETWLKYFADTTNTVTANSSANNATSNNTTAYSAGIYADTTTDSKEDFKKNSKFANTSFDGKDTKNTANNDTADNINDNISNVNYFDKEIAKKPDETTYLDTQTTSNTAHLDRSLNFDSKKVKKVIVSNTETVNTATSVISANTVKFYANSDPANTIPMNSNRTRGEDDSRKNDFVTPLSNKTEEAKKADDVANGLEVSDKKEEQQPKKKTVKTTKESSAKEVTEQKNDKDDKKQTVAEKAETENDQTKNDKSREYYDANTKTESISSNTVGVSSSNNVTA